jgi:hypothetical protein
MPKPSWPHMIARRERLVEIITVQMLRPEITAELLNAGEAACIRIRARIAEEAVRLAQAIITEEEGRPLS